MGKVKAWIMDLEEQFYDKVDESDLCVEILLKSSLQLQKKKSVMQCHRMIFSMLPQMSGMTIGETTIKQCILSSAD